MEFALIIVQMDTFRKISLIVENVFGLVRFVLQVIKISVRGV